MSEAPPPKPALGPIEFPPELPISARRAEIAAAIEAHPVVIVCGEPGSGKTTQLPKICLALGRGRCAMIGHTQPRRIAARAAAARIAEELRTELGGAVGYKVRFTDRVSPRAYLKLMTDGILLAEIAGDRELRRYDTLIIDEAHERSLNVDFLLGYLKRLSPRRPDLKLVVASATLDAERLARYFGGAPVIEVSGRLYPIEVRYRPLPAREQEDEPELEEAIADAVEDLAREGPGDVLVFLPGEREIREAARALRRRTLRDTEILPLYARLAVAEQQRVFRPHRGRRVVLATNVAETSLTVPGIRYVVDSGLARVKRYSYRNKVEQLRAEKISQASAQQRAGRCGRIAAGVCLRLYSEEDFRSRPAFGDPEILRSSLAGVILRMKALGLGEVEDFPFLDPPPPRALADGYALLAELGAVDEARQLTEVGRRLAALPVDPRVARMVLAAAAEGSLAEVLPIAAALEVEDPRERPGEGSDAARAAHQRFDDEKSDFLAWLKLWKFVEAECARGASNRKLRELCRAHFLSFQRLREWRDVHAQLRELAAEHGLRASEKPATYAQIHRALLAGLLGNVGLRSEEGHYLGARGIKFRVHPSSGVGRKPGRWIVAAELAETTRLYARTVAAIDPEWLESVGAHLLKRQRYEPHWEKSRAQVVALERATLYGLPVYSGRRIHYGPLDPVESRRIFIRQALVGGDYDTRAPFFLHNRRLIEEIERLEHQSRRPDILVDEESIYAFYDSRIPQGIHNGADFERWRREAEAREPRLLFLRREDLMRHGAEEITRERFPRQLEIAGRAFSLEYRHEPGSPRDGVTMTVPLALLNQVDEVRCDWLVPGLVREKVVQLVRSLPQSLRQRLGAPSDFAEAFLAAGEPRDSSVAEAIARYARREKNLAIPVDAFRPENLPAHLAMNFRVVDEHGRELASGRNLAQLRAEFGKAAGERFAAVARRVQPAARFTDWEFGELEDTVAIAGDGETLIGYPALVDRGDSVSLEAMDSAERARAAHRAGLRRLFMLRLAAQARAIEKHLAAMRTLALQYAAFGDGSDWKQDLIIAVFEWVCLQPPLPRSRTEFDRRSEEARNRLLLIAQEIARLAETIIAERAALEKKLAAVAKVFPQACRDVAQQLERLLPRRFLAATSYERLQHFPRYLRAAALRLEKLRENPGRDARAMEQLAPLEAAWQRAQAAQARSGTADPRLEQFRWLLEELRVQLFAQELKTPVPVSVKRLTKMWQTSVAGAGNRAS